MNGSEYAYFVLVRFFCEINLQLGLTKKVEMVRVKFRNYCNVQLCSAHAQYDNFTVTDFSLIFREINGFAQCALVTSLTKLLL